MLNTLPEKSDLSGVMSTLAMLGILPKPQEFQRIFLVSIGKKPLADQLESRNLCFDPMSSEALPVHERLLSLNGDRFSEDVMGALKPFIADRSYATPHLAKRIIVMVKRGGPENLPKFVKTAEDIAGIKDNDRKPIGIMPLLKLTAGLYAAFGKKAPEQAVGKLDRLIAKHPGLMAALAGGGALLLNHLTGTNVKGQFDQGTLENPDMNDIVSRIDEQKQKRT